MSIDGEFSQIFYCLYCNNCGGSAKRMSDLRSGVSGSMLSCPRNVCLTQASDFSWQCQLGCSFNTLVLGGDTQIDFKSAMLLIFPN